MIRECSRDFKCVFVQWRGQSGVEITSPKLYSMGVWRDIKEPIDYIHNKHKRPIYMFSCSLGAICSTIYLINEGDKTPVKAATFYGSPLAINKNQKFFENSLYGLYSWVFGKSLVEK